MPHASEFATPPYQLVIAAGEKVMSAKIETRALLMQTLSRFAQRLPDPSERGMVLMWLSELPEHLPHYAACAGDKWRVSFSGEIGVDYDAANNL